MPVFMSWAFMACYSIHGNKKPYCSECNDAFTVGHHMAITKLYKTWNTKAENETDLLEQM